MDTHVKVLGVLNMLCGGLGLLTALMLTFVFGGVAAAVGASGDADSAAAIPIIGFAGMAIVGFIAVWSLPGIIVGFGLYRLRPWARVAGIILSVLALIAIPFGTLLGVYGLWVLFSKETEQLFVAKPAAP